MRRIGLPALFFFLCFVSTGWRQAQAQTKSRVITFDAPGAGTTPNQGQGTFPEQVSNSGLDRGIAMSTRVAYCTASCAPLTAGLQHSMRRAPARRRRGHYPRRHHGRWHCRGRDFDGSGSGVFHAFFGSPGGQFTTFDAPGAGTAPNQGTNATSINSAGTISGAYVDSNGVPHGFVRSPDGTITKFDPSGSVFTAADTLGLNKAGAITGPYRDANNVTHGFLRAPDGTITNFDAPGAGAGPGQGTLPSMITDRGTIPGAYLDANNVIHAFLRFADGTFSTFEVPGAATDPFLGTLANATNLPGITAGDFTDANGVSHGFTRVPGGKNFIFDAPGEGIQATLPVSINLWGVVTGSFVDANGVSHAFLRFP